MPRPSDSDWQLAREILPATAAELEVRAAAYLIAAHSALLRCELNLQVQRVDLLEKQLLQVMSPRSDAPPFAGDVFRDVPARVHKVGFAIGATGKVVVPRRDSEAEHKLIAAIDEYYNETGQPRPAPESHSAPNGGAA